MHCYVVLIVMYSNCFAINYQLVLHGFNVILMYILHLVLINIVSLHYKNDSTLYYNHSALFFDIRILICVL